MNTCSWYKQHKQATKHFLYKCFFCLFFNQCTSLISVLFFQRFSLTGALSPCRSSQHRRCVSAQWVHRWRRISWCSNSWIFSICVFTVNSYNSPSGFDRPLLTVEDLGPISSRTLAVLLQMLESSSLTVSCLANGTKFLDDLPWLPAMFQEWGSVAWLDMGLHHCLVLFWVTVCELKSHVERLLSKVLELSAAVAGSIVTTDNLGVSMSRQYWFHVFDHTGNRYTGK